MCRLGGLCAAMVAVLALSVGAGTARGAIACYYVNSGCGYGPLTFYNDARTSGWIANILFEGSMDNETTGTAKRQERYKNGVGMTDFAIRAAGEPKNWWTSLGSGYTDGLWKCIHKGSGTISVRCRYSYS